MTARTVRHFLQSAWCLPGKEPHQTQARQACRQSRRLASPGCLPTPMPASIRAEKQARGVQPHHALLAALSRVSGSEPSHLEGHWTHGSCLSPQLCGPFQLWLHTCVPARGAVLVRMLSPLRAASCPRHLPALQAAMEEPPPLGLCLPAPPCLPSLGLLPHTWPRPPHT